MNGFKNYEIIFPLFWFPYFTLAVSVVCTIDVWCRLWVCIVIYVIVLVNTDRYNLNTRYNHNFNVCINILCATVPHSINY